MKRTVILITLALAALAASAERFTPSTGSSVKIEGTSTLHEWSMESAVIKGQISAPDFDHWNGPANVVVAIPITSIKAEHSKMEKIMADALKAGTNPDIRYELLTATPHKNGDTYVFNTRGKLTIAGVTKDVAFDVTALRGADGRYVLTGHTPIRMTAYGIKPPTAMMNTIKTGDDVTVTFRWVVERSK